MKKPSTQGDADGLCGIYCLINFMHIWNSPRVLDRESFKYLMRSAEQLSLLTPDRLHGGFEWQELVSLFNHTAKALRKPFKAIPFADMESQVVTQNLRGILSATFGELNGAAVIHVSSKSDEDGHWLLAAAFKGKKTIVVIDPSRDGKVKSVLLDKVSTESTGFSLLPTSSIYKFLD